LTTLAGHKAAEERAALAPVTVQFSMRCGASALSERKGALAALEASLRKVAEEFGGSEFQMARTRVGPSDDTLQRALSIVLARTEPDVAGQCFQTCTAWRQELEARPKPQTPNPRPQTPNPTPGAARRGGVPARDTRGGGGILNP